jgi:hypothetical protein
VGHTLKRGLDIMVSIDFVDEPSHSTTALHLTDSADEFVKQVCDSVHQMAKAGVPDRDLLVRLASAGEILAGKESTVSILGEAPPTYRHHKNPG